MADDPLIGRQLANFKIERVIGRGGMAQVYYGQDVKLERPVAIKVIDTRHRGNPAYAERFVREAKTVATWRHEHIVHIYYADEEDELYYFVMEYIDGLDLGELMSQYAAKGKRIPHNEVLRIGRAVAEALDYAHQQNVIHRDVKPANAMVARDGRVVLTDFGLAMDVEQGSLGEVFGSSRYIAPEQARRSADAVPQSDLYSLGIILYEMLTGKVPFNDPSPTAVALQHLTLPPPPPRELNPDLNEMTEAVLLKALSKSPDERYQTGGALIDALARALQTDQPASVELVTPPLAVPSQTDRPTEAQPMATPTVKRPLIYAGIGILILVIGLILVLLLAAAFLLWWPGGDAGQETAAGQVPTAEVTSAVAEQEGTGDAGNGSGITTDPPPTPAAILTATVTMKPSLAPLTITPAALPTGTPSTTSTDTGAATNTPPSTDTPRATSTPPEAPTSTVTPTTEPPTPVGPASYDLLIAKGGNKGEDSLFVVNLTTEAFPLASLRLGDDKGAINGVDWGIDRLENGACVTVWKNKGKPQPPEVTCPEAGERLTRGGKEVFWKETFDVYYSKELMGTCKKNQQECSISIATQ